jgi:hypothetical protein
VNGRRNGASAIDRLPMTEATPYILVALAVALNLPFGAWRLTTMRYSLLWFLAIHVPIPLLIVVRLAMGYGYALAPFLVAGAVAGQLLGARLYGAWRTRRLEADACD